MTLTAACLDCGLPYADFPLDVVLPRSQWLEIHPADGGLLCAACIVKRAARVPGCTVVHVTLEIAPRSQQAREVDRIYQFAGLKARQCTDKAFGDDRVEDAARAFEDIAAWAGRLLGKDVP